MPTYLDAWRGAVTATTLRLEILSFGSLRETGNGIERDERRRLSSKALRLWPTGPGLVRALHVERL